MFLLDTNVVSEQRKLRPHGAVLAWLRSVPSEHLFISAMTIAEIQAGIEQTREQDARKAAEIEAWMLGMIETSQVLAMGLDVARLWAKMMQHSPTRLKDDAWIAATAKCRGLTLVTRNLKDFAGFGVALFNPFEDTRSAASVPQGKL